MRAIAIAALLGISGCASGPTPVATTMDRLASSQSSIRAAEEVGAKSVPQAALHLQLAKEQLEVAKQYIASDENDRARLVLLRAESDAELALALARQHDTALQAQQAFDQARAVEQQLGGSR